MGEIRICLTLNLTAQAVTTELYTVNRDLYFSRGKEVGL
jgi:hypothetical protein